MDVSILTNSGRPRHSVSLKSDHHDRLFGTIDRSRFPLLGRMSDYYEEADYNMEEARGLEQELVGFRHLVTRPEDLVIVDQLIALTRGPLLRGESISAIAD